MNFRKEVKIWGENLASKYLEDHNYEIIDRNFSCQKGEVDLIAKDRKKEELVFIEVKTRSDLKYGNPYDSESLKKPKSIKQVIQYYIYKNQIYHITIRLDLIEVHIKKTNYKINHIQKIL